MFGGSLASQPLSLFPTGKKGLVIFLYLSCADLPEFFRRVQTRLFSIVVRDQVSIIRSSGVSAIQGFILESMEKRSGP